MGSCWLVTPTIGEDGWTDQRGFGDRHYFLPEVYVRVRSGKYPPKGVLTISENYLSNMLIVVIL